MTDQELLQLIHAAGPWVEADGRSGDYEICQWCDAYWGRRYPSGKPSYVSKDDHKPDCLWLKVEAQVLENIQIEWLQ